MKRYGRYDKKEKQPLLGGVSPQSYSASKTYLPDEIIQEILAYLLQFNATPDKTLTPENKAVWQNMMLVSKQYEKQVYQFIQNNKLAEQILKTTLFKQLSQGGVPKQFQRKLNLTEAQVKQSINAFLNSLKLSISEMKYGKHKVNKANIVDTLSLKHFQANMKQALRNLNQKEINYNFFKYMFEASKSNKLSRVVLRNRESSMKDILKVLFSGLFHPSLGNFENAPWRGFDRDDGFNEFIRERYPLELGALCAWVFVAAIQAGLWVLYGLDVFGTAPPNNSPVGVLFWIAPLVYLISNVLGFILPSSPDSSSTLLMIIMAILPILICICCFIISFSGTAYTAAGGPCIVGWSLFNRLHHCIDVVKDLKSRNEPDEFKKLLTYLRKQIGDIVEIKSIARSSVGV